MADKDIVILWNGKVVSKEKMAEIIKKGPRSPAFYLDMRDWEEDKYIWEQIQKNKEAVLAFIKEQKS